MERDSGGAFALQLGTLYPILHRLAKQGLIQGRWEREGRRRRTYELTAKGSRYLEGETREMKTFLLDLIRVLDGPDNAFG